MNAKMTELFNHIKDATIKVKWDSWFFAGGRDYGDATRYELVHWTGKHYGTIDCNDIYGITIRTVLDGYLCNDCWDKEIITALAELLNYALHRDDEDLISKLPHDEYGEVVVPKDFCDISREDVLTGRWKGGEEE